MVEVEQHRLNEADTEGVPWRRWGPYLSEQRWGNETDDERVHGGQPVLQSDPHWRDLLLFYEYFHGDNGAGIGASHQTGWTGTVALLPLLARGFTSAGVSAGGLGQIVGMATRVGEALAP